MKRQKVITALLVIAVVSCSTLFAAEADNAKNVKSTGDSVVTLTPAAGLSATSFNGVSAFQFDIGFHAALIGIPRAAKDSWLNNLTPIVNMDLGVGGILSEGGVSAGDLRVFQISALCGYSFKPITNLYLTPAGGLGFSTALEAGYSINSFSLPLFFGAKYFFTGLIGIEATIIDTIHIGSPLLTNTFVIKAGPTFRIGI